MTILLLLLPNRSTNHGAFFGNDGTLFGGGLACSDLSYEISQLERHCCVFYLNVIDGFDELESVSSWSRVVGQGSERERY